jgi:hypothetical protein
MASSSLQRVDLHCIQVQGQLATYPFDWAELDVVLSCSRFSNLKKVRVFCSVHIEHCVQLPRLESRGILELVYYDEGP